jgi:hypothetical protein
MDMDIHFSQSRYLMALRALVIVGVFYAILISNITMPLMAGLLMLTCLQGFGWSIRQPWIRGFTCDTDNDTDIEQHSGQPSMALKLSNGRWLKAELTHFYCLWWIQVLEFRTVGNRYTLIILPDSCSHEDQRRIRCFLSAGQYRRKPLRQAKSVKLSQ